MALHGCLQGREYVSTSYALNAGYVQVAEKNNIIVMFPQVTNKMPGGTNPNWLLGLVSAAADLDCCLCSPFYPNSINLPPQPITQDLKWQE
eukprot:Em0020g204a